MVLPCFASALIGFGFAPAPLSAVQEWFGIAAGMCKNVAYDKKHAALSIDVELQSTFAFANYPSHEVVETMAGHKLSMASASTWKGKHLALGVPPSGNPCNLDQQGFASWWFSSGMTALQIEQMASCGSECVHYAGRLTNTSMSQAFDDTAVMPDRFPCSIFVAQHEQRMQGRRSLAESSTAAAPHKVLAGTGMCQNALLSTDGTLDFQFSASDAMVMTVSPPYTSQLITHTSKYAFASALWGSKNVAVVTPGYPNNDDAACGSWWSGAANQGVAIYQIEQNADCESWSNVTGWASNAVQACTRWRGKVTIRNANFELTPASTDPFPCMVYVDTAGATSCPYGDPDTMKCPTKEQYERYQDQLDIGNEDRNLRGSPCEVWECGTSSRPCKAACIKHGPPEEVVKPCHKDADNLYWCATKTELENLKQRYGKNAAGELDAAKASGYGGGSTSMLWNGINKEKGGSHIIGYPCPNYGIANLPSDIRCVSNTELSFFKNLLCDIASEGISGLLAGANEVIHLLINLAKEFIMATIDTLGGLSCEVLVQLTQLKKLVEKDTDETKFCVSPICGPDEEMTISGAPAGIEVKVKPAAKMCMIMKAVDFDRNSCDNLVTELKCTVEEWVAKNIEAPLDTGIGQTKNAILVAIGCKSDKIVPVRNRQRMLEAETTSRMDQAISQAASQLVLGKVQKRARRLRADDEAPDQPIDPSEISSELDAIKHDVTAAAREVARVAQEELLATVAERIAENYLGSDTTENEIQRRALDESQTCREKYKGNDKGLSPILTFGLSLDAELDYSITATRKIEDKLEADLMHTFGSKRNDLALDFSVGIVPAVAFTFGASISLRLPFEVMFSFDAKGKVSGKVYLEKMTGELKARVVDGKLTLSQQMTPARPTLCAELDASTTVSASVSASLGLQLDLTLQAGVSLAGFTFGFAGSAGIEAGVGFDAIACFSTNSDGCPELATKNTHEVEYSGVTASPGLSVGMWAFVTRPHLTLTYRFPGSDLAAACAGLSTTLDYDLGEKQENWRVLSVPLGATRMAAKQCTSSG